MGEGGGVEEDPAGGFCFFCDQKKKWVMQDRKRDLLNQSLNQRAAHPDGRVCSELLLFLSGHPDATQKVQGWN